MLTLSRKDRDGEREIILTNKDTGERIRVCLIYIDRNQARLGIDASQDWLITREEHHRKDRDDSAK